VWCCHFSGTTNEQEAVAVTTAIQEEIFLEMGVGMFLTFCIEIYLLLVVLWVWSIGALLFI